MRSCPCASSAASVLRMPIRRGRTRSCARAPPAKERHRRRAAETRDEFPPHFIPGRAKRGPGIHTWVVVMGSGFARHARPSGHLRTSGRPAMSALPIADIGAYCDSALRQKRTSEMVIRSPRRRGRARSAACEIERLGGLEVDHQLVPSRRLHRQVGRLLALEDAVDVARRAPILVDKSAHRRPGRRPRRNSGRVDRGQPMPRRPRDDRLR